MNSAALFRMGVVVVQLGLAAVAQGRESGAFCGLINEVPGSEMKKDGDPCKCKGSGVRIIVTPPTIPLPGGGSVGPGGAGPGGSIVIGGGGGGGDGALCYASIVHVPTYHRPTTPGPQLLVFDRWTPGYKSIGRCDKRDCPGFLGRLFGAAGASICEYDTFPFGEYPLYRIVGNCGAGGPPGGGPTTGGPGTGGGGGPVTGTGGGAGPSTGGGARIPWSTFSSSET